MKEPPMDLMQLIAKDIADTLAMMKQHLADFSDADMLVRPVPSANHANWQVGHLLGFEAMVANLIGAKDVPGLPENFKSQYNSEAAKSDDPAKFMKKDELFALFDKTHAAIVKRVAAFTPEDIAKPVPAPLCEWVPTFGDLAVKLPIHTVMHVGQIQVIRRKLGRKIMF
jgi:hypothetical protein